MTKLDRYNENLDNVLKEYEGKSFKELMQRADEIFEVLNNVEDLIAEVIEIQGVLTARLLKGDVE